ncbi:hypothetical protein HAX54_008015, partial [Datura stramonium]|nr:hypothetical protein [Datura stramonium]
EIDDLVKLDGDEELVCVSLELGERQGPQVIEVKEITQKINPQKQYRKINKRRNLVPLK